MPIKPICLSVWSITYSETVKNRLPSAEKFKSALDNLDPAGYVFQLEKGTKKGRLHFQVNLRLKEKMTMSKLREKLRSPLRDYYGEGCMTFLPTHDLKKSDFYCMKDDTRVEGTGPVLFPPNIYIGQDLIDNFYPWQKSLFDMVMASPDDRKIPLICDPTGNTGKSVFTKTLGYRYDACVIPLGLTSAQMKSAIVSAGPKDIYILDLPRNNRSFIEIFDTIEEIKRGFVVSCFHGKFKQLYMCRPHVVCFTNEFPQLDLLSFDMWDLYTISSNKELDPVDKFAIQRFQNHNKNNNRIIPTVSSLEF